MELVQLYESLGRLPWERTGRIWGNSHAFLIGFLVTWWLELDSAHHRAIEGGPSFAPPGSGFKGTGTCDALLCVDQGPIGVLEVEGQRPAYTARKIGKFFESAWRPLQTLEFGVLLVYPYEPKGGSFPATPDQETIDAVREVTSEFPGKGIIFLTLQKQFEHHRGGAREKNRYAWGRPSSVSGILYVDGNRVEEAELWCRPPN